jgi:hypothetical protein
VPSDNNNMVPMPSEGWLASGTQVPSAMAAGGSNAHAASISPPHRQPAGILEFVVLVFMANLTKWNLVPDRVAFTRWAQTYCKVTNTKTMPLP